MNPFKKIKEKAVALIFEGLSPEKVSLAVTFGVLLGIFPVLATTSILCLFAGKVLKLNHILLQVVNQAVYPLQLLLLIPFIQFGRTLLGKGKTQIGAGDIMNSSRWGDVSFYTDIAMQQIYGVFFWSLLFLPVFFLIYRITLKFLKIWVKGKK